jgi:hypothetical protein
MKKFPKLDNYTTDNLIILVFVEKDEWQKEAVIYAKHLLRKRGISDDYVQKRLRELDKYYEQLWEKELEDRKVESYSVLDIVFMILFWYRDILWDWYLKREGYERKRKQRLIAISSGILFYTLIMLWAIFESDYDMDERIQHIEQVALEDSIAKSKIDWTGTYTFEDTGLTDGIKEGVLWKLDLEKEGMKHYGRLSLEKNKKIKTINCVGIINDDRLDLLPDTTYRLFDGYKITYYDRLFSLTKKDDEIAVYWGKIKPFYHEQMNGKGLFKKRKSM